MGRERNVLGGPLESCGADPVTGFYRDGCCRTGLQDRGKHVVCATVTDAFLEFSKANGNDLITPQKDFGFVGLKAGDAWCLCTDRWEEARQAGVAPPILLEATHEAALLVICLDDLREHAKSSPV